MIQWHMMIMKIHKRPDKVNQVNDDENDKFREVYEDDIG